MKKLTIIILVLTAVFVFSGVCPTATAFASAMEYPDGEYTYGLVVGGENALTLKSFSATFQNVDYENFIMNGRKLDNSVAVNSSATLCYVLQNNTQSAVTANLLLPSCGLPDYLLEDNETFPFTDGSKYSASVNDSSVSLLARFVGDSYKTGFDDAAKSLSDEKIVDNYYNENLRIFKHTCEVSSSETNETGLYVKIDKAFPSTAVMVQPYSDGQKIASGALYQSNAIFLFNGNTDFEIYLVENDVSDISEYISFVKDSGGITNELVAADATLTETASTEMTFGEFADLAYDADYGISENDWYNLAVKSAREDEANFLVSVLNGSFVQTLMCFYQFTVSLNASETAMVEVTVPLYPSVFVFYEPYLYQYNLMPDPAGCWKGSVTCDFAIESSFFVTDSYLTVGNNSIEFSDAEGGASAQSAKMPQTVNFEICSSENPKYVNYTDDGEYFPWLAFLFIIGIPGLLIFYAFAGVAVVGVAVFFVFVIITAKIVLAIVLGTRDARRQRAYREEKQHQAECAQNVGLLTSTQSEEVSAKEEQETSEEVSADETPQEEKPMAAEYEEVQSTEELSETEQGENRPSEKANDEPRE